MAYSPKLVPILEKLGYKWIIIDEIAKTGKLDQSVTYKIKDSGLVVFFRDRGPSNLIMSAMVRREEDLKFYLKDEYTKKDYIVTGMDGETFGHHRPGLQTLLTELLTSNEFQHVFFYLCNGDEKTFDYKDGEVEEVRWMSEEEIRASMHKQPDLWAATPATFEDIVEILKEKLNKT